MKKGNRTTGSASRAVAERSGRAGASELAKSRSTPFSAGGRTEPTSCTRHSASAPDSGAERWRRNASVGNACLPTPTGFPSSSSTSGILQVSAWVDAHYPRGAGAPQPREPLEDDEDCRREWRNGIEECATPPPPCRNRPQVETDGRV